MISAHGYLTTLLLVTSVACGGETAEPIPFDPVDCQLETYRIVSADVPLSASASAAVAVDLDGDGLGDNAGGGTLAFFLQQFDSAASLPELVNTRLQDDETAWFIALNQCADQRYLFWVLRGQGPDADGVFALSPRDAPPAQGSLVGSTIAVSGGGFGEIPIGIFADPLGEASDIWSSGAGVAGSFERNADTLVGNFGLGLSGDYFEIIGRPLAAFFTSRLQAGTSEFAAKLDTDQSGIISLSELREDEIVEATLLRPDLDLLRNGIYDPARDGVDDSLSFSFSIRAERTPVRWQ